MCLAASPDITMANVRALMFRSSWLEKSDLERAIRACPLLEQFSYYSGGVEVGETSDQEFVLGVLMRQLQTRKNTLKHLDLNIEKEDEYLSLDGANIDESWGVGDRLGSFADFPVLETLIVPPHYLADAEQGRHFHNSGRARQDAPQVSPPSRASWARGRVQPSLSAGRGNCARRVSSSENRCARSIWDATTYRSVCRRWCKVREIY